MPNGLTLKRYIAPSAIMKAEGADGLPEITISTMVIDRQQDTIVPEGISVPGKVPVLFAHNYGELPVGEKVWTRTRPQQDIRMGFRWLEGDERAARVENAFRQNMLSASVGFGVIEKTPNKYGGYTITKSELYEVSLCAVPANPECVRELKRLGLWSDEEIRYHFREEDLQNALRQNAPLIARAIRDGAVAGLAEWHRRQNDVVFYVKDVVFYVKESDTFPANRGEVDKMIASAIAEILAAIAADETRRTLNYHRGRLDD